MTPAKRFPTRCLAGLLALTLAWPIHPAYAVRATAAQEGTSRAGLKERLASGPPHDRRAGLEEGEEQFLDLGEQVLLRFYGSGTDPKGKPLPILGAVQEIAVVPSQEPGQNVWTVSFWENDHLRLRLVQTIPKDLGSPPTEVVSQVEVAEWSTGASHLAAPGYPTDDILVFSQMDSAHTPWCILKQIQLRFGHKGPLPYRQLTGYLAVTETLWQGNGKAEAAVFDSTLDKLLLFVGDDPAAGGLAVKIIQRTKQGSYLEAQGQAGKDFGLIGKICSVCYDPSRKLIWVLDRQEIQDIWRYNLSAYEWNAAQGRYGLRKKALFPPDLSGRLLSTRPVNLRLSVDPVTGHLLVANPQPALNRPASKDPELWVLEPRFAPDQGLIHPKAFFLLQEPHFKKMSMPMAVDPGGRVFLGLTKQTPAAATGQVLYLTLPEARPPAQEEEKDPFEMWGLPAVTGTLARQRFDLQDRPPLQLRNPLGISLLLEDGGENLVVRALQQGGGEGEEKPVSAWTARLDPREMESGKSAPLKWSSAAAVEIPHPARDSYRMFQAGPWRVEVAVADKTRVYRSAPPLLKVQLDGAAWEEKLDQHFDPEGEIWLAGRPSGEDQIHLWIHLQDRAWKNPRLAEIHLARRGGSIERIGEFQWHSLEEFLGKDETAGRLIGLTQDPSGGLWSLFQAPGNERLVRFFSASAGLEEGEVRAVGRGKTPEERVRELEGEVKKASLNLSEASEALRIGNSDWEKFYRNGFDARDRAKKLLQEAQNAAASVAKGDYKKRLLERLNTARRDFNGLTYQINLLNEQIREFRGTQELRRIKTRRLLRDLLLRTPLPWWGRLILGGGLAAALISGYVAREQAASLENRNQPLSVRGFGEESAPVVRLAHSTEDLAGFKFPEGQKAQWFWFRQTNLYWLLLSGEDPNERFVYANRFAQAEGAPGISGAVFLPLQTLADLFNSDNHLTDAEYGLLRDLLRMKLLVRTPGRFQPAYPDPGAVVITPGAAGLAGPYGHIHKVIGDREPGYFKSSHPPEGVLSQPDEPKGGLEEERRAPLTRDGLDRYL